MKKVLSVLVCILLTMPAFATGDATPTSKGYVDAQMDTLQDNLPAAATNTVVTTTATAGETGTKSIYDASGNYAEQMDALVTAEDANTAIQMAINGELVCREYDPTGQYCYVYDVRPTIQNNILPTGYTALEYIESTGKQWINTGIRVYTYDDARMKMDAAITSGEWMGVNGFLQMNVQTGTYTVVGGMGSTSVSIGQRDKIDIIYTNQTESLYVNNGFVQQANWSSWHSEPYVSSVFIIFGLGTYAPIVGKLYSVSMVINGTLVGNFIPARRNSDDEVGLYDTVSNTFFTNSGTGAFIAGPDLNVYLPSGN